MHDVIIFGDMHADPACFQVIAKFLPELKTDGYETIYMESSPRSIEEMLKDITDDINHLEAFPDGQVPVKNKRTEKQENVLKNYASYKNFPDQAVNYVRKRLEFLKGEGRLEWCNARKTMLETAIKLEMQIICIDVQRPQEYRYAGGIGKRTEHMSDEIRKKLDTCANSRSIFITGFGHIIDTWEDDDIHGWKYNRGIIRMLAKSEDISISHTFLIYSSDTEQKKRALKNINECASKIIQKIKIVNLINQLLPPAWQALIDMCDYLPEEKKDTTKVVQYRATTFPALAKFREEYICALEQYIVDLGGKSVQRVHDRPFVQFEISSCVLDKKERLARLSLERALFQITLNESQIIELKTVLCVTIEDIPSKGTLLTFVSNDNTRDKIIKIMNNFQEIASGQLETSDAKRQNERTQAVHFSFKTAANAKADLVKKYELRDDSELELERGLRKAACNNKPEDLKIFMTFIKNINARDDRVGKTALHLAAKKNHLVCIRFLLEHGADPSIEDKAGGKASDETTEQVTLQLLTSKKPNVVPTL